jgi:putative two-component system response regulator
LQELKVETQPSYRYRVAVVDDEEHNRILFQLALREGPYDLSVFKSGKEFLESLATTPRLYHMVLLDVMMPEVDGFEVCRRLRADQRTRFMPVIMVTGLDDTSYRIRGLEMGANDYLGKPFHPLELKARMSALLRVSDLNDELKEKNALLADDKVHLEGLVKDRTKELEDLTLGIVAALEKANEMSDLDTGLHIARVSRYSELLARAINLLPELITKITRFASLHDVGKVGIPDEVLKKPGTLTAAEFDEMKKHTVYGYEILKLAKGDLVAQNIAWCHHEKWNGRGYPRGLVGDQIPLEARVVALADVFDALTTRRVYKNAYSLERSREIIETEAGIHFDPTLVAALRLTWADIVMTFNSNSEA